MKLGVNKKISVTFNDDEKAMGLPYWLLLLANWCISQDR